MTDTERHDLRVFILTRVMGYEQDGSEYWIAPANENGWRKLYHETGLPSPLTDLNAAFAALEAWYSKTKQWIYFAPIGHKEGDSDRWMAWSSEDDDDGSPLFYAYADTPATAICLAIRAAVESTTEKETDQ